MRLLSFKLLTWSSLVLLPVLLPTPMHANTYNEDPFVGLTADQTLELLMEQVALQNWRKVVEISKYMEYELLDAPATFEGIYQAGIAYFEMGSFQDANKKFKTYLQRSPHSPHLEDVMNYKYQMAESYRHGLKKPIFGIEKLPNLLSAQKDAIDLYGEVANGVPHQEIATYSLLHKGTLQVEAEEFDEALETLQSLQRRFPKHTCAKDSYVLASKIYLIKAVEEFPDSNLIEMAKINLRNFEREFPGSDLDIKIKENLLNLQEIFAKDLVEIMDFYLRTNKVGAARLYAERILRTYPDTSSAKKAMTMLSKIAKIEAKKKKE